MNNWLPLLATLFIQAMVSMALLTLPVMAPVAAKDLAVSPALVGIYVALTYLGAMFSSLTSGTSVTRFGPIRVSQLGLILCAMGLCLCAVPWLPATGLGAFLIGLGIWPDHTGQLANIDTNNTGSSNVFGVFNQTNWRATRFHVGGRHCSQPYAGSRLAIEFNQRCVGVLDQCHLVATPSS